MNTTTNTRNKKILSPVLKAQLHFDVPISLFPFLFHRLERASRNLFRKIQRRNELPHKMILNLYCNEDRQSHVLEVKLDPYGNFYQNLMHIESELLKLDLSNPIISMDIALISTKRVNIKDKIQKLFQSHITTGHQKNNLKSQAISISPSEDGEPFPIDKEQLTAYSFICHKPLKKTPFAWEESRGRDYYLALDPSGRKVWIYFDILENGYFKIENCA